MNLRRILFWALLLIGVGLCVGGIFCTPLLIPGAGLIAAAGALHVVIPAPQNGHGEAAQVPDRPITNPRELEIVLPEGVEGEVDIELHIGRQLRLSEGVGYHLDGENEAAQIDESEEGVDKGHHVKLAQS